MIARPRDASTACYQAAAALACVALVLLAVPLRRQVVVAQLSRVEAPREPPIHPHPFLQLAGGEGPRRSAWVSSFLDLGPGRVRSCRVEPPTPPSRASCFLRSATHTRSFLITYPKPWDADAVAWHAAPSPERRFVQVAVVQGGDGPSGETPPIRAVLDGEARSPWALRLAGLAVVLAILPHCPRLIGPLVARRWGVLALLPVLLVNLALLWDRNWIDSDEAAIILPARDAFLAGRYVISEFTYPQISTYLHMAGTAAYGLGQAVGGGLGFHDPVTNQLYRGGVPFDGQRFMSTAEYRRAFVEEATRPVRNLHAVLGMLAPLLAYALGRRLAGERAGFFAGLSLSLQPLLLTQSTSVLPNVPVALLSLLLALGLQRPLGDFGATFRWMVVAGLAASKFNPSSAAVGLVVAIADAPARRLRAAGVACLGIAAGFLLGHPSAPFDPQKFLHDVAKQAYHYGHVGHSSFEVDRALPGLPHILYLWPRFWGNYVVLALCLLGGARLLARLLPGGDRRGAVVVLGLMAANFVFLASQFVQFGRNYLAFLGLVCVCAGLGADSAAGAVGTGPGSRRRTVALAALLAAAVLSLGSDLWRGQWLFGVRVTAREQAIRFVNDNAPLGSRVGLWEPPAGALQGVTLDAARLQVTRLGSGGAVEASSLAGLDYLVVADGDPPPGMGGVLVRRFGPAGVSVLPERYAVLRLPGR